jgi:hypothetical protein
MPMVEACGEDCKRGAEPQAPKVADKTRKRKTMARDFDDEWLQESSDTLVRAQMTVGYTFTLA